MAILLCGRHVVRGQNGDAQEADLYTGTSGERRFLTIGIGADNQSQDINHQLFYGDQQQPHLLSSVRGMQIMEKADQLDLSNESLNLCWRAGHSDESGLANLDRRESKKIAAVRSAVLSVPLPNLDDTFKVARREQISFEAREVLAAVKTNHLERSDEVDRIIEELSSQVLVFEGLVPHLQSVYRYYTAPSLLPKCKIWSRAIKAACRDYVTQADHMLCHSFSDLQEEYLKIRKEHSQIGGDLKTAAQKASQAFSAVIEVLKEQNTKPLQQFVGYHWSFSKLASALNQVSDLSSTRMALFPTLSVDTFGILQRFNRMLAKNMPEYYSLI